MKKVISVIAPMYNESSLVHEYCAEMLKIASKIEEKYYFEIILVNDGSKDDTLDIMREEQMKHSKEISIVCLSRNFGLEGAVNAGLRKAKGDAVIVMDADLQDPPTLIPNMIEKWENGYDVVVCSRIKRSNDSFFKKFTAKLYYKILDSLSGKLKLEQSAANFRLLSRKAVVQILALPEVNSVFRVVVPYIGMKTAVIGYDRDKRFAGETKYNFSKMLPYAMDSITGISIEPLRKIVYFMPVSVIISAFGLCMFLSNSGFLSHIYLVLFLVGICFSMFFVGIAVMSEYIAQIFKEVKGRPSSIIYEYLPADCVKERIDDELC